MSAPKDGGPAFPVPDTYHPNGQVVFGAVGMSLRDWFAGQALAGLLAADQEQGWAMESAAKTAYRYADAMIAAREVKP